MFQHGQGSLATGITCLHMFAPVIIEALRKSWDHDKIHIFTTAVCDTMRAGRVHSFIVIFFSPTFCMYSTVICI